MRPQRIAIGGCTQDTTDDDSKDYDHNVDFDALTHRVASSATGAPIIQATEDHKHATGHGSGQQSNH